MSQEVTTLQATADLVPEGAVATHAFRVVFYINADGDEAYSRAFEGSATLSSWLGSLELLKEDVIADFRGERGEGEDEPDARD